jgi:hypothetical protein
MRAGIQLEQWPLEAQAVGAQQVHAVALGNGQQFGAGTRAQARRQHQRGAAADAACHFQRRGHLVVGQGDQGQIGTGMRQIGQRAGHVDVEVRDGAGKAAITQAGQQGAGQGGLAVWPVAVAGEHDDRLGREQRGQVVLVHGQGLWNRPSRE